MLGAETDWPQDYSVRRGNTFNFRFSVAPLNATGAVALMTWVSTPGTGVPTTAAVSVAVAPNGVATSTFAWSAAPGVTAGWAAGTYEYAISYVDSLGTAFAFGHGAILVG